MIDEGALSDPGEVPVLDWIEVDKIGVEETYQRPLDLNKVEDMVKDFTWRLFGALVVVPQADGTYHAADGQHRLEAARMHPMVSFVPCVIVKAEDIQEEASVFVGVNRNRKAVTSLELFFAMLTAGDDDATTILQVCQRAGVRIPKHPGKPHKPGDTVAIGVIQAVIGRRGAMRARQYLEILAQAGFAPISANLIKAVEHIMNDDEFSGWVTLEDVGETLKAGGAIDIEAKRFAQTHRVPLWQGLANVIFQRTRKKRPAQTGRAA